MTRRTTGSRRGLTIVELLAALAVTSIVAAAVVTTASAIRVGLDGQAEASRETARVARVQARIADHLFRARMILHHAGDEALLWLPAEAFDGTASNATDFDRIDRNELRWYVFDRATGCLVMQRTANRSDRTACSLSTDWPALRTTLAAAGALERSVVLEGVQDAEFVADGFDPCSDRRLWLRVELDAGNGGAELLFGGVLSALQRHGGCQ
ncbi:MAG: prepilin-type N-terminal cleavage/methylation domain-containing protein [Phycisphaerales bacterium]